MVKRNIVGGNQQSASRICRHAGKRAGMHLLAESQDVLALFSEDSVHGGVVGHDHVVLHVRLRRRQAELDQPHLRVHTQKKSNQNSNNVRG